MYLNRIISLKELESLVDGLASYIIVRIVNEMRAHFKPVEDSTILKIQVHGVFLRLTMFLPEDIE